MSKKVTDFITGKVTYDEFGGQYFWISNPKNNGQQMLGELRGWGHIQNMFKDQADAANFQDEIGRFVADAINEKIERLKFLTP
jgi:hypothetical protein